MPEVIHVGCKIARDKKFEIPELDLYEIINCPKCGIRCQYFVSFNTGVHVLVNLK